jgi:hypothetical protein
MVVSGYASFEPGVTPQSAIQGDPDDDIAMVDHTIHMVVGPQWKNVRDVSPIVARAGFGHTESDEADATGYVIDSCTWQTVASPAPNTHLERIRLVVKLRLRGGGASWLTRLAYHLTATGTLDTSSR